MTHGSDASTQKCDILVVGGGPAGCTVAPFLHEKGYSVVVLDKDRHPRFHIGESLLPANLPLFEKMGVAEEIKAIGMPKHGADFVSPWHTNGQEFRFAEAMDKSMPSAYQIERSEFDLILINNARKKGVEVIEGCEVKTIDFAADGSGASVQAQHDDGSQSQWQARFIVDASGRNTFLANKMQIKERSKKHNSVAIYAHFAGAARQAGIKAGNITIFWFDHGWFWYIPLASGATSVGMVTWPHFMKTRGKRSLEEFFQAAVNTCKPLQERLSEAKRITEMTATGNFSYASTRTHGKNYLLLGDAYAFVDPVFSSGVWLAMNSGYVAASAIDTCLREPAKAAAALSEFDRVMKKGPKEFSWFIHRVTNPTMRDMFMSPTDKYQMKASLLSLLAGDIFGKTPIWRSIALIKGAYYLISIANFRRTFTAWQRRRNNIQRDAMVETSVTSS